MPELIKTRWYPESVLKAYYRFESGALTTDSSGEGHTLTAISTPAEDASGKFGGAVVLDGVAEGYSATDHADFKPTGNFTMAGWAKWNASASGNDIIFQSYSANTNVAGIRFYIDDGIIIFVSGRNNGTTEGTNKKTLTGTVDISGGAWHFVVCTWDGSYMRTYVDGAEDVNVAWSYAPVYAATNYVRVGIGNRTGTNENFFQGSLDDVFLLNGKALNAYEVLSIYRTISPGAFLMNLATNWKNN